MVEDSGEFIPLWQFKKVLNTLTDSSHLVLQAGSGRTTAETKLRTADFNSSAESVFPKQLLPVAAKVTTNPGRGQAQLRGWRWVSQKPTGVTDGDGQVECTSTPTQVHTAHPRSL